MKTDPYMIETLENPSCQSAALWLKVGVSALAVAGAFAIMLALLRTPGIEAYIPYREFFHTAIVVHVDLSVVIWMLAISGLLWSVLTPPRYAGISCLSAALMGGGAAAIAAAPFVAENTPLMNNYVPVLTKNILFFLGLSLVMCAAGIQAILALAGIGQQKRLTFGLRAGIYGSAIMVLVAFLCFVLAHFALKNYTQSQVIDDQSYYELLFWGGGHVLQFAYTQLMVVAWILLAGASGVVLPVSDNWLWRLFALNLFFVLPSPIAYGLHAINSAEIQNFFTGQMRHLGGFLPLAVAIMLVIGYTKRKAPVEWIRTPEAGTLLGSIVLFGIGGVLGHMISASNVTIPAHYHGSLVGGVSIALMGLVYYFLPRLGYAKPGGLMVKIQPSLYAAGQLIHVLGFAWSGGYGALRKTAGANVSLEAKIGLGMMGAGGMIAVIGGLLFVIIAFKSLKAGKK